MQYVDLVIFNGAFNDRYENNSKCIYFSIKYTVINVIIEEIDWINVAACLLSYKPFISYATPLNRYSDIIIFQEREGV